MDRLALAHAAHRIPGAVQDQVKVAALRRAIGVRRNQAHVRYHVRRIGAVAIGTIEKHEVCVRQAWQQAMLIGI